MSNRRYIIGSKVQWNGYVELNITVPLHLEPHHRTGTVVVPA